MPATATAASGPRISRRSSSTIAAADRGRRLAHRRRDDRKPPRRRPPGPGARASRSSTGRASPTAASTGTRQCRCWSGSPRRSSAGGRSGWPGSALRRRSAAPTPTSRRGLVTQHRRGPRLSPSESTYLDRCRRNISRSSRWWHRSMFYSAVPTRAPGRLCWLPGWPPALPPGRSGGVREI